jgi:hypothetical protein
MTRQARIDAPGALHHIVCRGIERERIFLDAADRDRFIVRLAALFPETSTSCFAWALYSKPFPRYNRLRAGFHCDAAPPDKSYAVYFKPPLSSLGAHVPTWEWRERRRATIST